MLGPAGLQRIFIKPVRTPDQLFLRTLLGQQVRPHIVREVLGAASPWFLVQKFQRLLRPFLEALLEQG